jgi:lantibiotic modifying enzyme
MAGQGGRHGATISGPERSGGAPYIPGLFLQAASLVGGQLIAHEQEQASRGEALEGVRPTAAIDLYGGLPGLALFWAAMARALPANRSDYTERSLSALQVTRLQLLEWISEPQRLGASGVSLGGLCGLGGAIYALTCVGVLLGRPDLLREALAAASLVTPELVTRDVHLDLVEGTAGTLLALLALDRTLSNPDYPTDLRSVAPRTAARFCAEHLLARLCSHQGSPRTWVAQSGQPFCGFAHGSSGILYSLLCASAQNAGPQVLEVAREVIAFERNLYRPHLGNWIPFPGFSETADPLASWCWGAPGIALERIAALHILDDETVREDIRSSLARTLSQKQTLEDHICCGNMGRVQILEFAARTLAGSDVVPDSSLLRTEACQLAYNVLRCAKGRGGFGWSPDRHDRTFRPFFFKGSAGVGYAFLYLSGLDSLPLPLLLEAPPSEPMPEPLP